MKNIYLTVILLSCSNIFMTFAWYGHLKNLNNRSWILAALISWGIAFFEYMLQVPANRIGYKVLNVGQLKIIQEVITLAIFVPFSIYFMKEKMNYDYLWAALCLLGAVFFIFRTKILGL
ncbi:MAG: DMT family protein [bacterium]|nr:DMT family protein [bacterium]